MFYFGHGCGANPEVFRPAEGGTPQPRGWGDGVCGYKLALGIGCSLTCTLLPGHGDFSRLGKRGEYLLY